MLSETDDMGMGPLLRLGGHSSDSDIKKHILTIKKIMKESQKTPFKILLKNMRQCPITHLSVGD